MTKHFEYVFKAKKNLDLVFKLLMKRLKVNGRNLQITIIVCSNAHLRLKFM